MDLAELIDTYRAPLVGLIASWGVPWADAAEIAQDSFAEAYLNREAFINECVNVMITEMDIDVLPRNRALGADVNATERQGSDPYRAGLPDDVQRRLADRYGALFAMFMRYPQITRVTLWGVGDGDSWLNNFPVRGRTNHPLLFDRQLRPKPAHGVVVRALRPE